jgi:hypothetical protein
MNARSLIVAEEATVRMENAFACKVLLAIFVKMWIVLILTVVDMVSALTEHVFARKDGKELIVAD